MHGSFIMGRMALAAEMAGAAGIRANTAADIREIRRQVCLPVIGIIKRDYPDSEVYITPTEDEVDALAQCGTEIIAMDATDRVRPGGHTLEEIFKRVRARYPEQLFMADCSTYTDAVCAEELGFDIVGTTMVGYTQETKDTPIPNLELIRRLTGKLNIPLFAEGGIHTPEQLRAVLDAGAYCAVVGGAITRPLEITRRFLAAIDKERTHG